MQPAKKKQSRTFGSRKNGVEPPREGYSSWLAPLPKAKWGDIGAPAGAPGYPMESRETMAEQPQGTISWSQHNYVG